MKVLKKIVLYPKLENDRRQEVIDWCRNNFIQSWHQSWSVNSNYTEHGCFQVTVIGKKNARSVTAFILIFPEVLILEEEYDEVPGIDEEVFNKIFEYS